MSYRGLNRSFPSFVTKYESFYGDEYEHNSKGDNTICYKYKTRQVTFKTQ